MEQYLNLLEQGCLLPLVLYAVFHHGAIPEFIGAGCLLPLIE